MYSAFINIYYHLSHVMILYYFIYFMIWCNFYTCVIYHMIYGTYLEFFDTINFLIFLL